MFIPIPAYTNFEFDVLYGIDVIVQRPPMLMPNMPYPNTKRPPNTPDAFIE